MYFITMKNKSDLNDIYWNFFLKKKKYSDAPHNILLMQKMTVSGIGMKLPNCKT